MNITFFFSVFCFASAGLIAYLVHVAGKTTWSFQSVATWQRYGLTVVSIILVWFQLLMGAAYLLYWSTQQ